MYIKLLNVFCSTSHKTIGKLYLFFGALSSLLGTGYSILMRVELSSAEESIFIENGQLYNVCVTSHAFIMVFYFIMPILLGYFGNFMIPLQLGVVDMLFPRLNNISF